MDLRRPLRLITPTLDGDLLAALAAGEVEMTGRELSRLIGASQEGVRRTLERLTRQGIVLVKRAGTAHLYRLNREHLAAKGIELLANLRQELIKALRWNISHWTILPIAAVLFGSAARGDAGEESDIDILVIRPSHVDANDTDWRGWLARLQSETTSMTGNDTRILEYSDEEIHRLGKHERVLVEAAHDGVDLFGSFSSRFLAQRKPRR